MASKKGTCKQCGRSNVWLPAKGMCGRCYNQSRHAPAPLPAAPDIPTGTSDDTHQITLDFRDYPDVYESLLQAAKTHIRTPGQQALWCVVHTLTETDA